MLIVMKNGHTKENRQAVMEQVKKLGFKPHELPMAH